MNNQLSTKQFFERDEVKKKFQELMGKRSTAFMTSVLQIVSQNQLLAQAEPTSIYQAAAVAATLNLPINNNLGYAYIVPYKNQAQFQLGYKGLKQLAQRSGRFKLLNDAVVKEGEIKSLDRLTGTIEFDWIQDDAKRLAAKTVGYVSYFLLDNGFSQTFMQDVTHKHTKKDLVFGKMILMQWL
jgi:recombination protein RecT